ncbi:sugar kinase [Litoreibacter roseus]|uniref:Sugar kinase n=2 Tax=Litoreibacter roseus TaxID=2601869 RepID=A0A6N6JMJ3_9RHOB|nr:sugar kinase [Litoreibacter roseus]
MLGLGIDIGTSGVRTAVIDPSGTLVSDARAPHRPGAATGDADAWWGGVSDCLRAQVKALRQIGLDPHDIVHASIDGTSGTMVLVDEDIRPIGLGLLYNSSGFHEGAEQIARLAPEGHITRGSSSALARYLTLLTSDQADRARYLLHQADFILARLTRAPGHSDDNNALKLGFDPETLSWPAWFERLAIPLEQLPKVHRCGEAVAPIAGEVAQDFGLSPDLIMHAGTTDSIAAFLASGATTQGEGVTSLGTTLAIKLLSDIRVDSVAHGLYSHRLGSSWLVGGASNTGGGALLRHFDPDQMSTLSEAIDASEISPYDYHPLPAVGERFPINDPNLAPRDTPRPASDAAFLHGLLESIARIEGQCYGLIKDLGGPPVSRVLTAGGGAENDVWTAIRARVLGVPVETSPRAEAAIGAAMLAMGLTAATQS